MFSQDVLVEFFSLVELTHGLVEPRQVVGGCNGYGVVVMLVVLTFRFGSLQRSQEVFLLFNRRTTDKCYKVKRIFLMLKQ